MKTQEEIEQLAESKFNVAYHPYSKRGFIDGYTQCQLDRADKIYTAEDIINMLKKSRETGLTAEYLILQLNKQD